MSPAHPEQIVSKAKWLECKSVAYTYIDPVIFREYDIDTALVCKESSVLSVAVSAGYDYQNPREELYAVMDVVNIGHKSFSEKFYFGITGAHLEHVLHTFIYIRNEADIWLEITTLLIPGLNDSNRELDEMTRWINGGLGPDVPIHFTPIKKC